MKFKLTPSEGLGQTLRSELTNLFAGINDQLNEGLKDIAQQGEAKAKDWAATRLHRTRQQYENALNAVQLGPNKWAIVLDADAAYLEEGYPSFDMKPGLLALGKPLPPAKNGSKGIRVSKDGFRYRAIPIDQNDTGVGAGRAHPDSQVQIQNPITRGPNGDLTRAGGPKAQGLMTKGDLKADMDQMIKKAGIKGIIKDSTGVPILGKVATITGTKNPGEMRVNTFDQGKRVHSYDANLGASLGGQQQQVNPLLSGLVKYQYEVKKKNGGTMVKSAYMTFRMVSEKQQGKWIHPGFWGARIFPDLERWAETALSRMVEDMLRSAG